MNRFTFLKRQSILLFCLFAFSNIQAQGGLNISHTTSCTGKTIDVLVKTDTWTNVTSMQFTLEWDETVLEYVSTSLPNNTFMGLQFGTNFIAEGKLGASWFDGSSSLEGISTSGSVTCFVVKFNVIGSEGNESNLAFSNEPTVIEFSHNENGDFNIYNPILVDGSVSLETPTIVSQDITDATVANNDGAITVVADGGTSPYEYVWNDNATGPSISNLAAGTYYCTVTDASTCSSANGPFVVQAPPSATNDIENLQTFDLSPNPASDQLNVHIVFASFENTEIRVLSVTGKVLYQTTREGNDFSLMIPLTDFSNGTYFLEVKTATGTAVEKLVVNK